MLKHVHIYMHMHIHKHIFKIVNTHQYSQFPNHTYGALSCLFPFHVFMHLLPD